jgi:hypothetical protein
MCGNGCTTGSRLGASPADNGLDPRRSMARTLRRGPGGIRDSAERHWLHIAYGAARNPLAA